MGNELCFGSANNGLLLWGIYNDSSDITYLKAEVLRKSLRQRKGERK